MHTRNLRRLRTPHDQKGCLGLMTVVVTSACLRAAILTAMTLSDIIARQHFISKLY